MKCEIRSIWMKVNNPGDNLETWIKEGKNHDTLSQRTVIQDIYENKKKIQIIDVFLLHNCNQMK